MPGVYNPLMDTYVGSTYGVLWELLQVCLWRRWCHWGQWRLLVSLRAVAMTEACVGWCCQPRSQCALSPAVLLCSQAFKLSWFSNLPLRQIIEYPFLKYMRWHDLSHKTNPWFIELGTAPKPAYSPEPLRAQPSRENKNPYTEEACLLLIQRQLDLWR